MSTLGAEGRAAADAAVAVDQIGLAPQLALPFRSLLQQVAPGDAVVVRRVEAAILDRAPHRLVEIADQPAIPSEPGEDRQIALGDAEGLVDLAGVAPFGDDPALPQHQAVRAAAWAHRAERLVPGRLLAEIGLDDMGEVAPPGRLALGGEPGRGGDRGEIETGGGRLAVFPCRIWRGKIGHSAISLLSD